MTDQDKKNESTQAESQAAAIESSGAPQAAELVSEEMGRDTKKASKKAIKKQQDKT